MNRFRNAAASAPDPLQAALALRAQGRPQEALEALSIPGEFSADFHILRGDLQFEAGQIEQAAETYLAVTAEDPDHVYAQGQLGLCLSRLKLWEAAAHAFEVVLQFDPHRDEVRLQLADCLLQLRRFEAALTCFDECWSEGSRRRALFGKAVALQLLRRLDEAEKLYERLLAIDPAAEEALANLIAMSMEVFELARVQKYSQRLLEINSHSTVALKGLALISIERLDYAAAARYFHRALELDSEIMHPPAEQNEAIEYRISRKIFDSLEESRRQLKFKTARASTGAQPR
ncbi:MAG: tetratricopeptide repeat protein [Acidobacteriota bacterium]